MRSLLLGPDLARAEGATDPTRRRVPGLVTVALLLPVLVACGDPVGANPDSIPPGPDTSTPFPIDRGDEGSHTPGSYKGLPLRLVDRNAPVVTPVDGVVGVVCVGMSNARQECDRLIQEVTGAWAAQVRPEVRVVNCAVGGHAIERWNDPAFDDPLWEACLNHRLPAAGVRGDQVRVILHKAANQFTTGPGGTTLPLYPDPASDFWAFHTALSTFATRVVTWFPALQAVYTSSRSFGGFTSNPGRGEPLSYEEGHALNQWSAENPVVGDVWFGWAAYLWAPACASGEVNGSGVCYERDHYVEDGVHPSSDGRLVIAHQQHAFLLGQSWYAR